MKYLIDSLTRLYTSGKVTKEKLNELEENGSITKEDYTNITGDAY